MNGFAKSSDSFCLVDGCCAVSSMLTEQHQSRAALSPSHDRTRELVPKFRLPMDHIPWRRTRWILSTSQDPGLHPLQVLSEIMDPKWVPEVGGDCSGESRIPVSDASFCPRPWVAHIALATARQPGCIYATDVADATWWWGYLELRSMVRTLHPLSKGTSFSCREAQMLVDWVLQPLI